MSLAPGTRLGPYEILARIGAGGMGEVYRARDAKLNRDVALKMLPEAFATDPDRLARLRREAQVLAALNHPNIGHIYGFEDNGATQALVMELVDGPTLAERLAQGPLPLTEALPVAKQIADALEAAHEQGIVHRDLKPANIKVRADGTVKVLDFGLAKSLGPAAASDAAAALAASPTTTSPALTERGVILGTAAYMSPEQAAGKAVDKRSDLWSFGVVLFEMLTGRRVFDGPDVVHVLAAVLKSDPDWTRLPAETPPAVRRLLRRCLEKDRRRRLADAADARLELDEAGSPADREGALAPTEVAAAVRVWRVLPWTVASLFGVALIAALLAWPPWRSVPAPAPRKLLTSIGADASLRTEYGASAILSPNGTMLAFVAQQAGQTRLFVRTLDQLQAAALAGTEDAADPFFSPDGQWIAFFAGGKLKKVPVTGGAAVTLCDAPANRGGTWADDDTIIFMPTSAANTGLLRIPAAGGTPAVFGTLGEGATTQRWPQVLPGGKDVLYTEHSSAGGDFDGANLVVAPLTGGTPKVVLRGAYSGRYVRSGHLIYMQQGKLVAVRFDLDRLETIGQSVPALEDVAANPNTGGAQLDVSAEGTLVYVPGAAATAAHPIDWMTRDGKTSVLRAAKANWANPRFSPDGQKLALEISHGKYDIWVYEWARDTLTQVTFDPAGESRIPVWTPDGRRIVFASDRAQHGIFNLYWVNADGTGGVTRLTDSPNTQLPLSWHFSGKYLAFQENRGAAGPFLMILPMEGDALRGWSAGKPTVFLNTPALAPMFSPDGRWIAYISNEAGERFDVYVRPFTGPGGPWRISTEGGWSPRWSATTHELLFENPSQSKVMFAPYTVVGESFRAGKPQIWSPTSYQDTGAGAYDLHPDGKRLALLAAQDQGHVAQDKVVFVFNLYDYLRKVTAGRR